MNFWHTLSDSLAKFAAEAPKISASPPAKNPFPADPNVTKWMAVFVDVEKVAKVLGVVLPQAAIIANDMELVQPLIPYLIKLAENGRPIQPGDPAYEHPSGNPDAMHSGSDNVSLGG